MSGVLRAGGGPARLLVALLTEVERDGLEVPYHAVFTAISPSSAAWRLYDLKYIQCLPLNPGLFRLTKTGYAAARALRDGS